MLCTLNIYSQKKETDANIIGHVMCDGEHLPFASIYIKGTNIGTTSDETGHYKIINIPIGTHILVARSVGYKSQEIEIDVCIGETKEINFELEKDVLNLSEVVITGERKMIYKKKSSIIVNTLSPKLFDLTQSTSMGENLNYCPGLRMENNCQNCGSSQVRMNGMDGPYSQILINGRPIFSSLASVYGLELIPTNMIDRIEIVRGGGSALYGSNAIAGTINIILKDPSINSYEFGISQGIIGIGIDSTGGIANDFSIKFNTSIVSTNNKTGMTLYGFYRNRNPFDANNDDFSELSLLKNLSMGTRLYHKIGTKSKLSTDFFIISEKRRGGDKFDYPVHESNITESAEHFITTGALNYERYFRKNDLLSIYLSAQKVDRDSYYGANQSLNSYGKTQDVSLVVGAQYNVYFDKSNLIFGVENNGSWLKDKKLGYPDIDNAMIINDIIINIPHVNNTILTNQTSNIIAGFAQYEYNWERMKIAIGLRLDKYNIKDKNKSKNNISGNILNPRINFKYDFNSFCQGRISYSQGYRAPQIFDEDLHVETSGARQIIHINSPNLKIETSRSYMMSLDFNKNFSNIYINFLIEGFFTKLNNPFTNVFGLPDSNGIVIYTRINADDGASVMGVNIEFNIIPFEKLSINTGFTLQSSKYDVPQEFNEKRFMRTPNNYGYIILDYKLTKKFGIALSGIYTGKMLVPYFGNQIADPMAGELRNTQNFFDFGLKTWYNVKINCATLQLFIGIKNIFNSYQKDFDVGLDRDPGYIYGPAYPRTINFGIKIGNAIK